MTANQYVYLREGWPHKQWRAFLVTKMTKTKVWVQGWSDDHVFELDRSKLDQWGYARKKTRPYHEFFSEEGRIRLELHGSAERAMAFTTGTQDGNILGIGLLATRAEIIAAFRAKSKVYHPDHGGSPEQFRELCELKQKALRYARNVA